MAPPSQKFHAPPMLTGQPPLKKIPGYATQGCKIFDTLFLNTDFKHVLNMFKTGCQKLIFDIC